ncbi:MAG: polysaccharide deacetylase family protein [Candidatus Pacearchaeota archaeon]|jgi:peptidoglycan/xylan/chitin deacetylase (PgdA/CDA1 family)
MVKALFGFDVESIYSKDSSTDKFVKDAESNKRILSGIDILMDKYRAERTLFILGKTLKDFEGYFSNKDFKKLFPNENPLVELAQHTYNHLTFNPISSVPNKECVDEKTFIDDVKKANGLMKKVFGKNPVGIRTPYGYSRKIPEQVADSLKETGLEYISSCGRDSEDGLNPRIIEEGNLRQPSKYNSGLLEVPSHGWQDSAFTGLTNTPLRDVPKNKGEISSFYKKLFRQAKEIEQKHGQEIYLGFVMHPWAINIYDSNLEFLSNLMEYTKKENIENKAHRSLLNN